MRHEFFGVAVLEAGFLLIFPRYHRHYPHMSLLGTAGCGSGVLACVPESPGVPGALPKGPQLRLVITAPSDC